MINEKSVQQYCCEDISKIYGYKEAIADKEKMWECHHCLGLVYSIDELIEMGLYYNQPAERLMFVTTSEHKKLHLITNPQELERLRTMFQGHKHTPESKQKVSQALKGRVSPNKGKKASEETRKKMSEARSGSKHPLYGKHHSEESRKKMSEAAKRRYAKQKTQDTITQ